MRSTLRAFRLLVPDPFFQAAAHYWFLTPFPPPSPPYRYLTESYTTMTRILLVEDNELNRDMLSRRLQRKGFQVLLAVDGQEGLQRARAELPDLILMDMNLPIVDGWEATQQLKADELTRGIPVIGLTAHAMAGDREKCLAAGCDQYDSKPVELDRLLEKIRALLPGEAP